MKQRSRTTENGATGATGTPGSQGATGANGIDGTNGTSGSTDGASLLALSPAGTACTNGGVRVDTGVDTNRNSVLDTNEITDSEMLCNLAAASPGHSALVSNADLPAGDPTCARGGAQLSTGTDDDDDGVLDAGEIDATTHVCDGNASENAISGGCASSAPPSLLYFLIAFVALAVRRTRRDPASSPSLAPESSR